MGLADDFEKGLNAIVPGIVNEAVAKVAGEIATRLVDQSPVDTGQFQANWRVQPGSPSGEFIEGASNPISRADAEAEGRAAELFTGGALYFDNNTPYSDRLEAGSSPQASDGIVAPLESEFEGLVEDVVGGGSE